MLDVPNESADTYFLVAFVEFADSDEEVFYFVVVDNGQDGVVHFRPCVGTAMGVAVDIAAPLDVFPEGESPYGEYVKHIFDTFVVGLIVYYQD